MLFALTNELQVFKPCNPKKAVWHGSDLGPYFSFALAVGGIPMNFPDSGASNTKSFEDEGEYNVNEDAQGASVLTGSSRKTIYGNINFTCVELEVFLL